MCTAVAQDWQLMQLDVAAVAGGVGGEKELRQRLAFVHFEITKCWHGHSVYCGGNWTGSSCTPHVAAVAGGCRGETRAQQAGAAGVPTRPLALCAVDNVNSMKNGQSKHLQAVESLRTVNCQVVEGFPT